ncbi:MAG: mannose-1-phosphate guanylyltransferase/mannose-6-phosphate isomerase [Alphaproteobacteria bacterium]|nr:mannose-1-phosphate guanylyltransferase/mannose-6-phosphate isomerase [Alphaproteobacteria bacterium]
MSVQLIPVIISGGAGSRLWPVSRASDPKPFMRLGDNQSLLQKTFARAAALPDTEEIISVINRETYFRVRDEYAPLSRQGLASSYVLEPEGRNTAPAVTAAALIAAERHGDDAVLLVLPADHIIANGAAFADAVAEAAALAQQGMLATFGIQPTRAETGYGYIETGDAITDASASAVALAAGGAEIRTLFKAAPFRISRFVEKPDEERARQYAASRRHLWNSGMFCFTAGTLLAEMQRHAPAIVAGVRKSVEQAHRLKEKGGVTVELGGAFMGAQNVSLDYALMEKAKGAAVVKCDIGWSDVGSWLEVSNLAPADADGNRIEGQAILHDTSGCYIHAEDRMVGAVGVEDLVIVDTADALLVARKDRAQDVRAIVQQLKRDNHESAVLHRTVYRPWGTYTVLEQRENFKIKRIEVRPGAALSLQLHHHRNEHWVVLRGTARVTNDKEVFILKANESTFIRAGNRHRLENPGAIDLVMIEVQSGEYLGEDDIVRFEDRYQRMPHAGVPAKQDNTKKRKTGPARKRKPRA